VYHVAPRFVLVTGNKLIIEMSLPIYVVSNVYTWLSKCGSHVDNWF